MTDVASPAAGTPAGRSRFDAAIFDLDGLLVDSEPLWRRAEIGVFNAHGVPLDDEQVRSTKGRFVGEVTRHWYERLPWPGPGPDAVAAEIVDAVAALVDTESTLKPGAVAALESCRRRGLATAVASSSPRRLIDAAVRRHRLGGWLDAVHSAELEPAGKPHPAIFLSTAAMLGADPVRCVVFEDAPAGVQAAKAAGMACVAVPEASDPPLRDAEAASLQVLDDADVVIDTLEALDDVVWARLERSRASRKETPAGG